MTISPERLRLALEQLDADDGFEFERFANEFLIAELPDLRPVGGVHDGGRDAFVHESPGSPHVFCQHSVTERWDRKVRETVATLRKNGFHPRELIYCTNRDIQRSADQLRAELRGDGVSLDIRDKSWFEAVANSSPGRIVAAERLAARFVDPLLQSKGVLQALSPALTAEEERVTAAYLQLELRGKSPEKGLTKACVEALVTVVLREATPEALVPRRSIHASVSAQMPGSDAKRAALLTNNALARMVKRNVVKHHTKEDAFTLAFDVRTDMAERLQGLLAERSRLLEECTQRAEGMASRLGLDFEFSARDLAADALTLLDYQLCERGRLAAVAMSQDGEFFAPRENLESLAERIIAERPELLVSLDQLGPERLIDTVPLIAIEFANYPSTALLVRLRTTADAYCLQFALQQTPDVQEALRKVIAGTSLLVDTSVLIPCMAERLLPQEQRRLSNLLRGAADAGCKIIVGDDVLNEIDTHLDRLRHAYQYRTEKLVSRIGGAGAATFEAALIRAYLDGCSSGRFAGTFDDYVELFKGRSTPLEDLAEYLREEFSIQYDEMADERSKVEGALADLFEDWKASKRRRPWVDEAAFETLVLHDVKAFLLVEHLRTKALGAAKYGHQWWWLVLDGSAFRFDRQRRGAGGGRVCMSPEFFARYVSLAPRSTGRAGESSDMLPVCLEVAEFGFIPPELRDRAIDAYDQFKDLPEYLRRRKLRELVNQAF